MKQIIKYPGAKNRIAPWIISHFPPHTVYLEPFAGSAACLLNKEPARLETLNDVDSDIVNLFRVLRDEHKASQIAQLISLTPWSRKEFKDAQFRLSNNVLSDIDRAYLYIVKSNMGISGSQRYSTGFKHAVAKQGPVVTRNWVQMPRAIMSMSARLLQVQVEQADGINLINKWGKTDTDTLIYVDPPYLTSTRKNLLYKHEIDEEYHKYLLESCIACKCNVIISGYCSPLYDFYLSKWNRYEKITRAEAGQSRIEVLWCNFDIHERRLVCDK